MLSAGFPQSAAAGRDALDTFMKDNLYKYDVIIMKDTDTGAQTYIVADTGPVHPARNGSRDGQKNNARWGERYSLRTTTDGRFVAVVDDDILANLDTEHWNSETKKAVQKAAAKALMKFSDGIVVNGITRKVNKVSRDEYTRSKDTIRLARNHPSAFADKMRAASAVDDVVIVATDWARDGGVIHPRTDKFVDFDHGKTLIAAGDSTYSAEVVVGITKNGNAVFYDVVDLTPVEFELKKEESHSAVTAAEPRNAINGDSSGDSIRKSSRNVNSVSENQTETENFKRWFGDWENDPAKASKVVNEDGTPKVVYHGTNAELKTEGGVPEAGGADSEEAPPA